MGFALRVGSVHPRACGELNRDVRDWRPVHGSSPRVRGTRAKDDDNRLGDPVHPRACGELKQPEPLDRNRYGSSPRVRGTPQSPRIRRQERRFIPARAGNSIRSWLGSMTVPVHPRACGELKSERYFYDAEAGSSPRVRGTPARCSKGRAGVGSAGGELIGSEAVGVGSSPRVRGTPSWGRTRKAGQRFIPARAGNSPTPPPRSLRIQVHPRACGELVGFRLLTVAGRGSSPRVRGTLHV